MIDVSTPPLRIAVVGPSRFGIGQPFAGGLEAHTAGLVEALHARHHRVLVFAGPVGEAARLSVEVTPIVHRSFDHQFVGRRDTTHPPDFCHHESEQYRKIVDHLVGAGDIDAVHNNSLHPAVVSGDPGDGSFVHVLHCPPFEKLATAHRRLAARSSRRRVIAVSQAVAEMWGDVVTDVVHNGVDTETWFARSTLDRGGAVWAGRIVKEKAPHLAIRAARLAGMPITLAGPVGDDDYFSRFVQRELGDSVRWRGPLSATELADVFRASRVGVVSPDWNEPFCLVAAEMMACGTPVAAFDRGGLREFVHSEVGSLAVPGDAVALASSITRAAGLDSAACAEYGRRHLSSSAMIARYETFYEQAAGRRPWRESSVRNSIKMSA